MYELQQLQNEFETAKAHPLRTNKPLNQGELTE